MTTKYFERTSHDPGDKLQVLTARWAYLIDVIKNNRLTKNIK